MTQPKDVTPEDVFHAAEGVISRCEGGYAVVVGDKFPLRAYPDSLELSANFCIDRAVRVVATLCT